MESDGKFKLKAADTLLVFGLVSFLARGLYIFLFPRCFSVDVRSWNTVADGLMVGHNPYGTGLLNYAPCWIQLLFLFKKISLAWHIPFTLELRLFLIAVETLTAMLLYVVLTRFAPAAQPRGLLLAGIALNPISILQVCLHCHFDVLVGFWILLAIYLLLRFHAGAGPAYWLAACLALGAGAATKTVPLCLGPVLASSARDLRRMEQCLGAILFLLPITFSLSIVYVLAPEDVEKNVLGYRSVSGGFGFTGLFHLLGLNGLLNVWSVVFEVVYGSLWAVLGVCFWRGNKLKPRELVICASILLVGIPAMGPGYALNYVYWFIPLLVVLYAMSGRRDRIFLLTGYAVATVFYVISYGFDYIIWGGFFLDILQTKELLDFGRRIHTKTGQMLLGLPLWLYYLAFVGYFSTRIVRKIKQDFKRAEVNQSKETVLTEIGRPQQSRDPLGK